MDFDGFWAKGTSLVTSLCDFLKLSRSRGVGCVGEAVCMIYTELYDRGTGLKTCKGDLRPE